MASKVIKKRHPMPKLGWKDQLIYLTGMILTGGTSLFCHFAVLLLQDKIAFSDPQVIARTVGSGNLYYFCLSFWLLVAFVLIIAGPYEKRIPIFGRSGTKYGPPAHPPIYPLLMRDKPKVWIGPKEAQKKKRRKIIIAVLIIVSFIASAALFPLSLYGRTVLNADGSLSVYDAANRMVQHYEKGEILSAELEPYYSSGQYSGSWHIHMVVITADAETHSFSAHSFAGDELQQLQTMLRVKNEIYSGRVSVSGTEKLEKVIQDQYSRAEEQKLLYRLFEIED